MCEFHDSNCNGLGDMWWTDTCIYFSIIDVTSVHYHTIMITPGHVFSSPANCRPTVSNDPPMQPQFRPVEELYKNMSIIRNTCITTVV